MIDLKKTLLEVKKFLMNMLVLCLKTTLLFIVILVMILVLEYIFPYIGVD